MQRFSPECQREMCILYDCVLYKYAALIFLNISSVFEIDSKLLFRQIIVSY